MSSSSTNILTQETINQKSKRGNPPLNIELHGLENPSEDLIYILILSWIISWAQRSLELWGWGVGGGGRVDTPVKGDVELIVIKLIIIH